MLWNPIIKKKNTNILEGPLSLLSSMVMLKNPLGIFILKIFHLCVWGLSYLTAKRELI